MQILQVTVSSTLEQAYEYVPRKYYPKDYGGDNCTVEEIISIMKEKLEKYRDYFNDEVNYGTDEKLREHKLDQLSLENQQKLKQEQLKQEQQQHFGVDGSFRKLAID